MARKIVILTEGHTNPHTAKTACSIIRYRPEEVVAVLDATNAGHTTQELLGVGGDLPIIGSLDQAPTANVLLIGIAPPGGKIPEPWRTIVLAAICRKMDVMSGLHDFLSDDPEFQAAAAENGVTLTDVRKNSMKRIATGVGIDERCLRIHTVGHDCSVGKMITSIEVTRGLKDRGFDAKFVATGQTGIMVEGDGCPIDCVVADFISGAAEQLVLDNQHHDIILIEGQGSLVHPAYSAVTYGLLHGCRPDGMILCYEVGREVVAGVEHKQIPPLSDIRQLCETVANIMHPSKVIGIAMNGRKVSSEEAEAERKRVRDQFDLPVCDVFRNGPDELVDAVVRYKDELRK